MEIYLLGTLIAIIISFFDLKRYVDTKTITSKLSVITMYGLLEEEISNKHDN